MRRETLSTKMSTNFVQDDVLRPSKLQIGNEQAMATLFARYGKAVYAIALRVLRDQAAAEDVMQEVFLEVLRAPNSYLSPSGSLGSWLVARARNQSIDALRRTRPSAIDDAETSLVGLTPDAQRSLMIETARQAIVRLPAEQRRTLEMSFFDGLTHSEIAEITGDPLGTVKTRIRNALLTLRQAFRASPYSLGGKAEENSLLADTVREVVISDVPTLEGFDVANEAIRLQELRREEQNISLNMADNLDKVLF